VEWLSATRLVDQPAAAAAAPSMPAPAPGRFLHSHRMAIGRLQQPIGPLEPLSTQEQREADSWAALSPQLQEFSAGLFDGKQRLFLRMFAFDSGECLLILQRLMNISCFIICHSLI